MLNVAWWIGFLKGKNCTNTAYMETKTQFGYVCLLLRSTVPLEALLNAMIVNAVVENGNA